MTKGHARYVSQSTKPLLDYVDESPPVSPFANTYRFPSHQVQIPRKAHRVLVYLGSCLFVVGVATTWLASHVKPLTIGNPPITALANIQVSDSLSRPAIVAANTKINNSSHLVRGPPTKSFRDNLRTDTKYITSWLDAGWNNDVMTYMNLIYLGHITDRVPILAAFTPSFHIGHDSPVMPFSEVFDIPRFISESGISILEWSEVKDPASEVMDDIGCWNVWEAVQYDDHKPRGSAVPSVLGLDIAYTKAPDWIKMIPGYEHDKGASFWALARLAYPTDRTANLRDDVLPSPMHGTILDPDEHLLCYDYLYYVGGHQMMEYEYEYAPAWRYVGKYLHWTEHIEQIAASYLRELFEIEDEVTPIPPYIAVHVRHGDFGGWCWEAEKPEDCFAPLSTIARRVKEVQATLRTQKNVTVQTRHVLLTSDDTSPAFIAEVDALGWVRMDHAALRTEERFGRWYPVVLDAVVQGNAQGFVGTDRSTFSMLSGRRVSDWKGGVAQMVKWGKKGADEH